MSTVTKELVPGSPLAKEVEHEAAQERTYGFWLYLMSDAIIFSLFFVVYIALWRNIADGPAAGGLYEWWRVCAETAVLLTSSITFGMASVSVARNDKSKVMMWLVITGALALVFLSLEYGEFSKLLSQNAGPWRSAFLSSFWVLVGTHGLHVTAGTIWLVVMLVQISQQGLVGPVVSRLERLGIFWHFLDIIWIGIFSVVYLNGLMP